MLDNFAERYGYKLTAEDFINKGALHVTHQPPVKTQLDYMDFVNSFVVEFGRKLVDMVHEYGKKAYVFYDDSWVGVEPYSKRFKDFNFDGLIKCVFSGYEVRLCAGADIKTHELRLHPYLFPVGLGGLPTFAPGGDPTRDAKEYWNHTYKLYHLYRKEYKSVIPLFEKLSFKKKIDIVAEIFLILEHDELLPDNVDGYEIARMIIKY